MALGKLAEAEEALVGPMLPMGVSSDAPIPGGAAGLYLLARICRCDSLHCCLCQCWLKSRQALLSCLVEHSGIRAVLIMSLGHVVAI